MNSNIGVVSIKRNEPSCSYLPHYCDGTPLNECEQLGFFWIRKMTIPIIDGFGYKTRNSGWLVVVKNNGWDDVDVVFIKTGYKTKTSTCNIRAGCIKDLLKPSIYGVGYTGEISKKTKDNKAYMVWMSMLDRCYSGKYEAYNDCDVCKEWHSFKVFELWFDDNYVSGMHLDKDLLVRGNRTYSPSTCVFITQQLNGVMVNGSCDRLSGITKHGDKYVSQITIKNKHKYIGIYESKEKANHAWRQEKAKEVVRHALLPTTPKILVDSLLNVALELSECN